jgi:hypothetical protein
MNHYRCFKKYSGQRENAYKGTQVRRLCQNDRVALHAHGSHFMKEPPVSLEWEVGGHQNQAGCFAEKETPLATGGIRTADRSARSLSCEFNRLTV